MTEGSLKHSGIYIFGIIYALVIILVGAIANYLTWTPDPVTEIKLFEISIWVALYLPMFLFLRFANWDIEDFGFCWNTYVLIFTSFSLFMIFGLIMANFNMWRLEQWQTSMVEAFARTGEELFFRGFIFGIVVHMFTSTKRQGLYAVLISSLAFTIIHTQTFLPEYGPNMFEVFTGGIFFGLLRLWTKSLLPGITVHVISSGGLLGVGFAWVIYFALVFGVYLVRYIERVDSDA